MRPRRTLVLAAALGCLLASACSSGTATTSDPVPAAPTGPVTYPVTVDNCGHEQTFTAPPSRVVILNGTSVGEVESFLDLGLGGTVVANAQSYGVSDDPALVGEIAALPTGGVTLNQNFDIPAEQLMALEPDLVVSTWSGGFDATSGFATREELAAAGARTLVNPVNCAFGKPDATAEEQRTHAAASVESSFAFLQLLGTVFDVRDRAAQVVEVGRARITAVAERVAGQEPLSGIVAFPGMSMMNANGLPAVMTGGIYDDVLAKAGVRNAFAGQDESTTASMSQEQLAAADVGVLVLAAFTPGEDLQAEADELFAEYPQWTASQQRRWVAVSDGVYLGPTNADAIEKIAAVAHPQATP